MELLGLLLVGLLPFYVPLVYYYVYKWAAVKNGYMSEIEQKYRDRQEEISSHVFTEEDEYKYANMLGDAEYNWNRVAGEEYDNLWLPIVFKRVVCWFIYLVIIFGLQPFDQHVELIENFCWCYTLIFNGYLC